MNKENLTNARVMAATALSERAKLRAYDYGPIEKEADRIFYWIITTFSARSIESTYPVKNNYKIIFTICNCSLVLGNIYSPTTALHYFHCKTKKDFSEKNTVIYGHNLKNQKMFADLAKVYNGELGENIEVEIYTENNFKKYKIFTCYMEEPNLNVIQKNWNDEEKQEFIDNAIKKSKIDFNCDIDYGKNLLTLITCDSTGKERIIVHAM